MSQCTCAFPCGGTEDNCPSAPGYGFVAPKEIFKKEYDGESICDLSRDVSEAFDERFNPAVADIPEIEHGFPAGTFTVTITWKADS
jgi:hypothetical protein